MAADPAAGAAPRPRLDLLVLNWRNGTDTVNCLQAALSWTRLAPRIWVVDNASGDGSVELLRERCPEARLITSEANRGFAGGNNLALRAALAEGAEHVLLLNNDAAIDEAGVERLVACLDADPALGVAGPLLEDEELGAGRLSAGGRDVSRYVVSRILVKPGEVDGPGNEALRPVDYVPGTVVLIRADALRAVGLFDEAYFFGGELADFCRRARQHGWGSAIDLRARASHSLDRSSPLRERVHAYYILRNRFLFIRKFDLPHAGRLRAGWVAYGAGLVLLNLLRGRLRTARALGLGLVDGLRGRFGGRNERLLA